MSGPWDLKSGAVPQASERSSPGLGDPETAMDARNAAYAFKAVLGERRAAERAAEKAELKENAIATQGEDPADPIVESRGDSSANPMRSEFPVSGETK